MKENDFFFVKNLGMFVVRMQKYPKSISIQKVSGTSTAPFLEYPCFIGFTLNSIAPNLHKIVCEKRIEVKIEIEISKDKK
jgi:hypothetical protein